LKLSRNSLTTILYQDGKYGSINLSRDYLEDPDRVHDRAVTSRATSVPPSTMIVKVKNIFDTQNN